MEQDKVSILFLAANPVNTPELELTKEYNYIDEEIQKGKYDDLFQLQERQAITAGDIQNTLLRFRPKIVHFSGHGSAVGALVFEDRNGQGDEISPDALSNLFEIMNKDNNIQCVVLNACYSEKQAKAIAKHVDCVVGMKRAVTDAAALKFAGSFYNALAHGESIRTAFDLACNQLDLQHISEEKTPKLLTREGKDASTISFRPVPKRYDISNTSVQDVHPAGVNWTKWGVIGGTIAAAITTIVALVPYFFPGTPLLSAEIIAPDSVNVGELAQFGAITEGGSPPYEYEWKFGDGTQAGLADASHGYNNSGSYQISLTVKDSKGTVKTVYRSLTVTQLQQVTFSAQIQPYNFRLGEFDNPIQIEPVTARIDELDTIANKTAELIMSSIQPKTQYLTDLSISGSRLVSSEEIYASVIIACSGVGQYCSPYYLGVIKEVDLSRFLQDPFFRQECGCIQLTVSPPGGGFSSKYLEIKYSDHFAFVAESRVNPLEFTPRPTRIIIDDVQKTGALPENIELALKTKLEKKLASYDIAIKPWTTDFLDEKREEYNRLSPSPGKEELVNQYTVDFIIKATLDPNS